MNESSTTSGESTARCLPTFKKAAQTSAPASVSTAGNAPDRVRFVATSKQEGYIVVRSTTRATNKFASVETR